jgi:hypothetical protein
MIRLFPFVIIIRKWKEKKNLGEWKEDNVQIVFQVGETCNKGMLSIDKLIKHMFI